MGGGGTNRQGEHVAELPHADRQDVGIERHTGIT